MIYRTTLFWLAIFCASLSTASITDAFERFALVSTEELKTLLAERSADKADFLLLNTLDEIIFRDRAIPGSINIPWSAIDNRYGELGPDRDRLIITYCIGYR